MAPWAQEDEHRLLMYLLNRTSTSVPNFKDMAAFMGASYSYEAVRYSAPKFYKLKKESESLLASSGAAAASTAPVTPASTKSKVFATSTKSDTGKRGRKEETATEDFDAGDDDNDPTPSKKRKVMKKDAGANVEKEQVEKNGTTKDPATAKTASTPKSLDAKAKGKKGADTTAAMPDTDAEADDEATTATVNGANGEATSV